jgi:hypothetical protein
MILGQSEDTENWKRKNHIEPCGELAYEEAVDQS